MPKQKGYADLRNPFIDAFSPAGLKSNLFIGDLRAIYGFRFTMR